MKYLVDCTISIKLKSLTHVIPPKTSKQVFRSNEHKCVEKNHFVNFLKKIMLETFVSKSILYVYQNTG
jgi:hypothetical protein